MKKFLSILLTMVILLGVGTVAVSACSDEEFISWQKEFFEQHPVLYRVISVLTYLSLPIVAIVSIPLTPLVVIYLLIKSL